MPADGGSSRRLTFEGEPGAAAVAGWSPDGARVLYASSAGRPFAANTGCRKSTSGARSRPSRQVPWGPASASPRPQRRRRARPQHGARPGALEALPRRHRRRAVGRPRRLGRVPAARVALDGNLASPCWVGGRIYFLSDHEGFGNVYSCTPDGEDLQRHSDHDDYYARNLQHRRQAPRLPRRRRPVLLDPRQRQPRRGSTCA